MMDRLSRWLISRLLCRIKVGSLLVVDGKERHTYGSGAPTATVHVRSPQMWRMLLRGSRGLAEAYAQGAWDSPDLVAVIRLAARNATALDRLRALMAPARTPAQYVRAVVRRSTRRRSRREIAAHYDLGNELFSRMLDPTMSYSCAVFEHEGMTLERASIAKLERVCHKLDLGPGDHVLEIGTGWGGFAIHAARTRGCLVTTTTISREQHDYAVEQVRRAGLSDRVTVLMEDYRDLRGTFDKLVSIEMIEAVGWRHLGTFFARCSELLSPAGAMLLQAITIDDRAYEVEKASKSFANTYIFPGGCLPSLEVIARSLARRTNMQAIHLEDLTPHYVETLRRWRQNFDLEVASLTALGYDERFRRLWTLYLSYCEGGFAERRICGVQLLLAKPQCPIAALSGLRSAVVAGQPPAPVAVVAGQPDAPLAIGESA
jgi:cyclopropane-fatty-acyl-phospholipid synthase